MSDEVKISDKLYVKDEELGIYLPAADGKRAVVLVYKRGGTQVIEGESTKDVLQRVIEAQTTNKDSWLDFTDPIHGEEIYVDVREVVSIGISWIDLEAIKAAQEQNRAAKLQMRADGLARKPPLRVN